MWAIPILKGNTLSSFAAFMDLKVWLTLQQIEQRAFHILRDTGAVPHLKDQQFCLLFLKFTLHECIWINGTHFCLVTTSPWQRSVRHLFGTWPEGEWLLAGCTEEQDEGRSLLLTRWQCCKGQLSLTACSNALDFCFRQRTDRMWPHKLIKVHKCGWRTEQS